MTETVTEHEVTLRSGAVAHFVASGPENGRPVVLLHGGLQGSSGWAGWRFMLPALGSAGFRVYAPDRPGFGQADTRPEHWPTRGFMSWTDFVKDFVDAIGLKSFALGGNSQGTQTAAYFATRYPEQVECMIMVACGGLNAALDIPSELIKPGVPFPQWDGTEESMRQLLTTIIHQPESVTDELVSHRNRAAVLQREAFESASAWNRRALVDPNFQQAHRLTGHLDQLTIPMIYLYGKQDVLGPVENAYLQEDRLPNVQFFYPDNCGHQGQTDQPEMFNTVFTEFLSNGRLTQETASWAGISTRRPVLPWAVG